jgi:glycogen synthase
LTNSGIGDVDELLFATQTGAVLHEFTPAAVRKSVEELLRLADDPQTRIRCRSAAEANFSLRNGARTYLQIYSQLTGQ